MLREAIGLALGVAVLAGTASVCRAAPQVTLTALEPLETQTIASEAEEKVAAFGDDRWLIVYRNYDDRLAGIWFDREGKPLGDSFPLLGHSASS